MSYIHLHVYSSYSLLSSTATVSQLVKDAKAKGFSTIALTDRNVMYGIIAFYKECLKQSIKPIIGLTVDVVSEIDEMQAFPLVLLAQNLTGFQNLLKITSTIQTKSPQGIPIKWLKHYTSGLIALTPGLDGEIEDHLLNGDSESAKEIVELYSGIFGEGAFYLALQDHGTAKEKELILSLTQLSKVTGAPLVTTNQVQFLEKEDGFAHECLLAIKNGVKLQDENRERLETDQYYLKDAKEMVDLFADFPDALENTIKIAQRCQVHLDLNQKRLPKYPIEDGQTAELLLEKLCMEGFHQRYHSPTNLHKKRLQYELNIINKMKFSDYFLIVWDFMRFARENGILTGPGRGSAAGSMVAYVLQITEVDPIEHHLLFERFLNPERISMPDIDIDFPDTRREEVIQYVSQKYGELHVAQIITFGTFAAKAAMRDVGRVFGFNPKEVDQLSLYIPPRVGISLKDAYLESEPLRKFVEESEQNQRLFATAKKLEGLPRHTSIHAAGVVISEQPLVQSVPIQSGHNEVYLTQYSMEYLEDVGLLKMDFLGLRNLSFMESILSSIYRHKGKRIDIRKIPLDDKITFDLLSKGDTTGVFQLESDGMRKVLKQLKPTSFEDIVAVNALYRPGPMENIPLFIKRKHGIEKIAYPHPDLEPILKNTYGVIVYQEQIIQIASSMAGFSLGEADLLRRAVSKKQKQTLDKERNHFVKGAMKNQYSEKTADEIYDLIVRFANYGFNRSHAVAYSLIAYQLAYLKANYPVHFMSCLLTSIIGNEAKLVQSIRELQQMEIKLLSPSINKSHYSFHVENGAIRYCLSAIRGVGVNALKEIVQARRIKPFRDLFDLCLRVSLKTINRKTLESLIYSGALDEFDQDRAVLLASLDVAIEHAQLMQPLDSSQTDLFSDDEFIIKPKYVEVDPLTIENKLTLEKEVLGLFLSDHPIVSFKKQLHTAGATPLAELHKGSKQVVAGVYINDVKKIRTKKGDSMAFLSVSDQSGETEAVVFPDVYKRIANNLQQGTMIVIEGNIEERVGKIQFIIKNGKEISEYLLKMYKSTLYLRIELSKQTPEHLQQLKVLVNQHSGDINVVLHYEGSEKNVLLSDDDRINGSEKCIGELKDFLGNDNVILKK
ncbi:DNA polymerase III subunit alpha [Bacillus sp. 1NLA3E]|uniref:DNA polymerase III subunit alpha n=1 Tax=Bacillus sp. 1NLA3E TaxID=666686 RepID=UPI000247E7AB|nr:DNA polymerase III subunit alpha [Bacillus sp. 1NLA3E]AGK55185.1 DNA polymerase III DnaE [Bacillus sp. 1NLA3E]